MLTPGNVSDIKAAPALIERAGRMRYLLGDKPVLAYWRWLRFPSCVGFRAAEAGFMNPGLGGTGGLCLSLGLRLVILSKAARSIHDRLERLVGLRVRMQG